MAKSRKHHPTPKAKKAYNELIVKAYRRLEKVVHKHQPSKLVKR